MTPKKNTRNAKGAGMIRQRTDGSWEARYTAGRDPGTGNANIKNPFTAKHNGKSGKNLLKSWPNLIREYILNPQKPRLGLGLIFGFPNMCKVKLSRSLWIPIDYKSKIILNPLSGAVYLSELNTTMIQRFYNSLEKNRGERAALSPKSIKNVHGVLHAALKKAAALRYIPYNPSDACELPVVQKKEIQPLDDTAIAAISKGCTGKPFRYSLSNNGIYWYA